MTDMDDVRRKVVGEQAQRLARIGRVLDSAKLGELSPGQALGRIEEIASGDDVRIVRVGQPGQCQIQTERA